MKPGDRYWPLVDSVWDSISIYDGPDTFSRQFMQSDPIASVLFASHWFQSEVRNGGFHQFFSNSTGVLAPEAASAYRRLEMPRTADVIAQAMSWFGENYPRDRALRQTRLEAYASKNEENWDPFRLLDDAVFDLLDEENGGFDAVADAFAQEHG